MSDTLTKTCKNCEEEFDGIYDENYLCDDCQN